MEFDKNIRKFFKFLKKITNESLQFSLSSDLKDFICSYERSDQKDFEKLFKDLFESYRNDIEKKSDNWLKTNEIEVSYGRKGKIHLSKIYKICLEIKQVYENKLAEVIKDAKDMKEIREQYKQLLYPDIFVFHMYRIFSCLNTENQKLKDRLQELENTIMNTGTNSNTTPSMTNNPLASVQLAQIIPKIMNSDVTRNLLLNIVNKININECNDVPSLMDQILKTTSDPELLSNFDSLFKTMFNTVTSQNQSNTNIEKSENNQKNTLNK